ncbi:heme peroxidase [Gautieria morchelliformis]|nr:heme peroxidase [Gautieria morchelliformis]
MAFKCFVAFLSIALAAHAATTGHVKCPDGNVASHSACCPFFALRADLQNNAFSHQCGEDIHETVLLSFRGSIPRRQWHDAIAFSPALNDQGLPAGGGADGSMLIFPNVKPNFLANLGMSDRFELLTPFLRNHSQVSAGDLIQFAAAVAIGNCPGAPKLEFMAGRPNATAPASDGLIPEPQDSVDKVFARMKDGGNFSPDEVVALLASHAIARSDHVDPSIEAVPFDSTPFTFDTQIFAEFCSRVLGSLERQTTPARPCPRFPWMCLQSDFLIARDPARLARGKASDAMDELAVIGENPSQLVDCSEVILDPIPASGNPETYGADPSDIWPWEMVPGVCIPGRARMLSSTARPVKKHTPSAKPESRSIPATCTQRTGKRVPLTNHSHPHPTIATALSDPIHEAPVIVACVAAMGDASPPGPVATCRPLVEVARPSHRSCGERTEVSCRRPVEWEFLAHPLFVERACPASESDRSSPMDMSGIASAIYQQ